MRLRVEISAKAERIAFQIGLRLRAEFSIWESSIISSV